MPRKLPKLIKVAPLRDIEDNISADSLVGAFCGGFQGPWRVLGGFLEGSGSSPEEILGSKKARKQREEEHNKEQKNNYI